MKVLLYFESEKLLEKSGIGRALAHQQRALSSIGVEYTLDKQAEDYDILHINTYGINSLNQINKARKQGKKVIYHAHSTEEDFRNSFIGSNQLSPLYKKYLINLYSRADQLITPTPYAKELLEGYGIKVPICAISNGIDLDKYRPEPKKEQAFRDYFQLSADQKVIISVGLYFERKGIVDFVEIARRMPEYTFIWFGHTPMYTIPKAVRDLVKENHPENVIFPGYIKGDVIEGAYSGADLFFFPSYEETEGIVVFADLLGGSPFKAAMLASVDFENVEVVVGTNLPMLIEIAMLREFAASAQDVVTQSLLAGKEAIQQVSLPTIQNNDIDEFDDEDGI